MSFLDTTIGDDVNCVKKDEWVNKRIVEYIGKKKALKTERKRKKYRQQIKWEMQDDKITFVKSSTLHPIQLIT